MTSATAGKPTVALLTTPTDRTLRTRGCPIQICVGQARARHPTKNNAGLRPTQAKLAQVSARRERGGTDGSKNVTDGPKNVLITYYKGLNIFNNVGRRERISLAIDHSPLILF